MKRAYRDFLIRIGVDPKAKEWEIEMQVGDYLNLHCLDADYNPNADGLMCYEILDNIDTLKQPENPQSTSEDVKSHE